MTHAQSIDTELDTASLTGKRLGPYNSFNPVNRVQIWQWCSALGDHNPTAGEVLPCVIIERPCFGSIDLRHLRWPLLLPA